MTIARRRQEIRAMTNMTIPFQHPTASTAPTVFHALPVKLGSHDMRTSPVSTSPRTSETKKQNTPRRKLTKPEIAARARADLERKGVLPRTEPDDIAFSQTSQGATLQRGGIWGWIDSTFEALENALAPDETKPEPTKPAARQKPAATGKLDDFLKDIEGDFKCFRKGKPCKALGDETKDETLKGKVVLIGWAHDDDAGIKSIRDLLAKHMNTETDYLVAETTRSEFQRATYRDRSCMGVAKERCIAGDLEGGSKLTEAAMIKAAEASVKFAYQLDPDAASEIVRKHVKGESTYKILNACQRVITPKYNNLSARQKKALNGLDQEYVDAINHVNEATTLELRNRNRHMRQVVMDNLPDEGGTLFVVLGGLHVDYLARGLETNDFVLELYAGSSYTTVQSMKRPR
jgi:hypothetical protein